MRDLQVKEGYFDTRVIYVSETGPKDQKKRLAIMDQDGANVKYLTLGNELVLTQDLIPQSNGNLSFIF